MTAAETTDMVAPARVGDGEWSIERIIEQTVKVQHLLKSVMKRDEHYGVIPGTTDKPTLLKPGAEKLCLLFRLCPEYETLRAEQSTSLVSYTVRCVLTHIPTGNRVATGLGSCNSREKKYVRPGDRKCPKCSKETIIKGKEEYGGGWLCFAKKGGCGAKFKDDDASIVQQDLKPADPSDLDNTILKMACKRALVAAVLNGTAASDCFTQDLEDLTERAAAYAPPVDAETIEPAYRATVQESAAGPKDASAPLNDSSSTGSSIGPNTKPPRANTIKHCRENASPAQVTLLHTLKSKVGGMSDDMYRKQLAAFKAPDGKTPIESSKYLCVHQISNLIDRYEAKIAQQAKRAEEVPDIGAIDRPKSANLDDAFDAAFPQSAADENEWLGTTLGFESRRDIPEDMHDEVVQLLFARAAGGIPYELALKKFQERRQ